MTFRLDAQSPNDVSGALAQASRDQAAGREQPITFEVEDGVPLKIPSRKFAGEIWGTPGTFGGMADGRDGPQPVNALKAWAGQWGGGPFGPGMGGEPQ